MIVFEREACSKRRKVVGGEVQMSMCRKCQEERGKDYTKTCRSVEDDSDGNECLFSSDGMRKDVRNYYSCDKCSNNKRSDWEMTRKTMNGKGVVVAKTTCARIYRNSAKSIGKNILKVMLGILGNFRWILILILLSDKVIGHGQAYSSSEVTTTVANSSPSLTSSYNSQSAVSTTVPNLIKIKNISSTLISSEISGGGGDMVSVPVDEQMQADFPTERNVGVSQTSVLTTDFSSSSSSEIPVSGSTHANNIFLKQQQEKEEEEEDRRRLECKTCPYIDKAASPNVTALLGKTAYLACRVKNLGDKTVSWVRHRDIHLLTIGRYTYTTDQRFRAILQTATEDYTLMIKYPQHRDSGIYECQVSTTPHRSHYVHLSVVEPVTEVVGGPDLFIDRGSTINLTCTVKFSPEPPLYIIWNHNNNIISYSSPRGGISVLTEKGETTTSYLLIQQAKPTDSGKYSCNPSNAASHSINVHVLNGELPAAMQTGGQMPQKIPLSLCLLFSVVLIFGTS